MDRIAVNDNFIEAHKAVHEAMCAVFKSMTHRLSGAEIKPQPQRLPVEVPSKPSSPSSEKVSEAVSEYLN